MAEHNSSSSDEYLSRVKDGEQDRVMMLNWSEYLIHTAGEEGALRALTYYENIGWISDEVLQQMTDYVSDMAEDSDLDDDALRPDGELVDRLEGTPFELHAGSLQYIAKLADDDVSDEIRGLYSTEERINHHRSDD